MNVKFDAGTRFQDTRNTDEEEDVVAKYEDKADSSWDHYRYNSYHSSFSL